MQNTYLSRIFPLLSRGLSHLSGWVAIMTPCQLGMVREMRSRCIGGAMTYHDTQRRYGVISLLFHWTMALLIIVQFMALGGYINDGDH
jgi:hypothetical protein